MQSREKNKITYLHFILSVLVILIHSINNETKFERLFSIDYGVGQFAVPLFFVISGFLFFRNANTTIDVKDKIRKRIYTLLVPFLLWNTIYYLIHLFLNPGLGLDVSELINAAFNYKYNPSFWFMYQLILLSVLSILFVRIIRNKKLIVIFYIIMALTIVFEVDIPYINEDATIYYFTGAVLSKLYNDDKLAFIQKRNLIYAFVMSVVAFLINRLVYNAISYNFSFRTYYILSIIIVRLFVAFVIFYLCDIIFSYNKVPKFMQENFFLYAIHYMIVKAMIIFMRFFTYKYLPNAAFLPIEITVFVLSPVVCVVINYYVSDYMKKRFAKAYKTLTGNR